MDKKHLRLRSLAAFLVPVAFAVYMMYPAPVGRLAEADTAPAVALVVHLDGGGCAQADIRDGQALADLLTPRWSVRTSEAVDSQPGDILLLWGDYTVVLRSDRQYLKDNREGGLTRQLPGKALYDQVLSLLNTDTLPKELQDALNQEVHS